MRVVNRFMHVELLLILLVLVTYATRLPKKWSIIFFVLLFIDNSFVAERTIRAKKTEIIARRVTTVNSIKSQLSSEHIAFAVLDGKEQFFLTQLDAMVASNYVHLPTVNGYSSGCPGEFGEFFSNVNEEGLMKWLNFKEIDSSKVLILRR